jgi:hypothetical protein
MAPPAAVPDDRGNVTDAGEPHDLRRFVKNRHT